MSNAQFTRQRVSAASVVGDYQVPMPAIFDDPVGPRTRRKDGRTSHLAGDRSQDSIPAVNQAVLTMVRQEGPMTGSELNRLYQVRADRSHWPMPLHFDSPRKRAGELAVAGLLVIVNEDDPRGTERVYALPEEVVS